MAEARLSRLEIRIMETLWERGEASIREMQEAFPGKKQPGYTTVQTMVYRMEAKKVVRRVRKLGNFHLFAAAVSRDAVQRKLVDDLLRHFLDGAHLGIDEHIRLPIKRLAHGQQRPDLAQRIRPV